MAACNERVQPQNPRVEKATAYLIVGLGSALGGMGRLWLTGVVVRRMGESFPWATLLVNIAGSFIIGLLAAFIGTGSRLNPRFQPFVLQFFMIGLCGGYTTFSSFSLQTLLLLRQGQWIHAGLNAVLSVLLCLAGVWIGWTIGQALNR
jgi:CrcB protein